MPEKQKSIHNAYCDYEVAKASRPPQIYSVKPKHKSGIKTHNMSKAMLAQTLASLFQYRQKEDERQMIIIIKDGYDVIDNRPEAEIAQSERDYFEERYNRELKRKLEANKHPFAKKLLAACGLLQKGEYHYERIITE